MINLSDIALWEWILVGVLGLVFLVQVYWYARYLAAPARTMRRNKAPETGSTPPVSVLICARNEGINLADYIHAWLSQDYPEYEVIIVDDGSEDNTRDIIEQYAARDERLRMTFVPKGARVGSTKKLALTLAAKAARYDYFLLTDADCVPESNQWIKSMMRGFGEKKDIVLGFSPYFADKGHINRLVRYETLFNGLHYVGAALCGRPYMGVGRNLAYRKSLFVASGGFSHLMTNRAGDDDLFVNHFSSSSNTAVVLNRESYTWSTAKKNFKEWWQQKRRHLSVSPAYRTGTKYQLLFEPLSRGAFYGIAIALVVLGYMAGLTMPKGLFLAGIACILFLVRWILQTMILNISARRMGLQRFSPFSILWFDIVIPLVNLWMLCIPHKKIQW